ncbi:D-alanyl-D-alanine carboxypeptidase DacB [Sporomusa acidovorans DSM 3132]|uniref:serine-type D-Ala-D-Ala carboxypeptidase n=1 Tax=Sporomusa acidovorans (strain ATCC 49682 / DSM 3132 / Mol) TaxID=1123286 RepID=A0ABZ3J429_SPOA4|nr:D-alanyl-D-alanine carboxypeptidase family protein [Sporomusa acidovorans]OZC20321.1 D-alanyl-D-alanine carboxypeptidase DacB precursor [Sporomusa acidovorans DSM 3132]SDD37748.1 D-alanyl-D-alanine carboxypeptidase (penicillin-binding protein 5/6) [Sporomusa acidovorans]
MRQLINLGLLLFICLFFLPKTVAAQDSIPDLTAKAAIVMEASTGKVLYSRNAEERRYPASTTKIITLITALEYGKLDDVVTASQNAATTEGSSLWLLPGEQLTLLDMLYGIMLVSGNDATVAVAEHISGSVDVFAKLMTEKAHSIGAVNSNFVNTSGLPDERHYTTAHDLAKIAAYGYKNPLFTQIVSTQHKIIPWPGKEHDRDLYNENRMLWLYDGANGVKTGYTDAAGRCLVSAANRNGVQLVAVVLDSERMWDDSIKLLNYGFAQLKPVPVVHKGDILKTVKISEGKTGNVKLVADQDIVLPMADNEHDQFSTVIDAPNKMNAPVAAGQKIGTVKVLYNNVEVANADLLADQQVERKSFFGMLWGSVLGIVSFVIHNFA